MDTAKLEWVLKRRLPGFEKLDDCTRLSAGASRETYRLECKMGGSSRTLALRRAPDAGKSAMRQGPGLETEAVLFSAARAAGVPGPDVLMVIEPDDDLGSGFAMDWIDGETLGARIARSSDFAGARKSLARQCGEILARLHSLDVTSNGLEDALEELTPEHAVRKTHAAYMELDAPQPMIDYAAMWLLHNLPRHHRRTLVHSDFRNGNLIVDATKGVVAVLDWELAHVGDPMRDLGWVCTRSWRFGVPEKPVGGFGDYHDLFAGYEDVSGHKVDPHAVKFWEVFGSFWWAVGTLSMGQSYRTGMEQSVERPAIGRRSSECQIDLVNLLIPGWGRRPTSAPRYLSTTSLPITSELLTGVRDFLRNDAASKLEGRDGFLARVAANSVDMVLRELELGADAIAWERQALHGLLKAGNHGDTEEMRAALCKAIRGREIPLDRGDLHAYLRDSVLAQVMIDQPGYAGAVEALKHGK